MGKVVVRRAGPLATVQDLGRPQHRRFGIAAGGALDLHAARVANLLVGNSVESALFEISFGPARFYFDDERLVACCGGDGETSLGKTRRVLPNEELEIAAPRHGCRTWLAVAGGVDVPLVLGSRATDLRGKFGGLEGRPLRDGDELSLGPSNSHPNIPGRVASWSAPNEWACTSRTHPLLRVIRGAEWENFTSGAREAFLREAFTVTTQADRMGARLQGPELSRKSERELVSEAVTPGTIQVANDCQPILLLGDCQTIGGYPKIAHVVTVDLPIAAQLRPNDKVRFALIDLAAARKLFRAREDDLVRFRLGLQFRFS